MGVQEYTLSGDNFISKRLDVHNVTCTIFSHGKQVTNVRFEFVGDQVLWENIKRDGLFSYSDDICGPIMGGRFNPQKEFIFTIGLSTDQVTVLSILCEKPEDAFEVLASAKDNPSFLRLESYQILSVMQQMTPKTQWGMVTSFYKELDE